MAINTIKLVTCTRPELEDWLRISGAFVMGSQLATDVPICGHI